MNAILKNLLILALGLGAQKPMTAEDLDDLTDSLESDPLDEVETILAVD